MLTVQDLIITLQNFWAQKGCLIHQGHDVETGAGTFNPATFLRCLGPEPYRAAYVEVSRRPKDGRYGQNPNRMQMFHQYQVIFKPSPPDIQQIYLESLEAIGFKLSEHDIRFVHDDWEQPTLGASGLGWEVWRDGMEVTQFTYFQNVGGLECRPVTVELTYGIERLAMVVQGVDSVWDLMWNDQISYADMFRENEIEWSRYNFERADVDLLLRHFRDYEAEAKRLLSEGLPSCAYDYVMKASHVFNVLDARGVISVTQRTGYIGRIRDLSRGAAEAFVGQREALGFPLVGAFESKHQGVPKGPPEAPSGEFDPEVREDFVLEVGSEELPATFVPIGARNLHAAMQKFLIDSGLLFDSLEVFGTPRRLTIYVRGLAQGVASKSVERRGPKASAPTQAIEGFFRSLGLPVPNNLEVQDGYIYGRAETPARSAAEILAKRLPDLILGIDFPKKMRWGDRETRYARPLRWFVALHGERVVPFAIDDLHSGRVSWAHSQLCPGQFGIKRAEDYVAELRAHKVCVDIDERKEAILAQLSTLEEQLGLQVSSLESVLPQVLHLSEWPQVTTAAFDPEFLKVPQEVLVSEMVHHQKYFPLIDSENRLSSQFLIVADNTPNDEICSGNMKVLSARLADGKFLYDQDLATPLITLQEKLHEITFREGLGTLADKAQRLEQAVIILHGHLPLGDLDAAKRAAALAKVDLASELVGEFPDLQGTIGKHYALAHGENLAVAQAIDEHYMPRGEHAPLPSTPAGTLLSLAERIDNILSCFALGLIPTSSSDPYGLRRQALGIIRILLQHRAHLPLREVLTQCYESLLVSTGRPHSPTLLEQVCDFFEGRIKTVFESFGLTKEETAASLTSPFSDVYDTYLRVQALHAFKEYPLLAEVFRRAHGQLDSAGAPETSFDPALLQEPAEKALYKALEESHDAFISALTERRYTDAYGLLSQLQPALAELFDTVRILVDEEPLKLNRLGLLQRVLDLFGQLIDFRVTIGGGGGR